MASKRRGSREPALPRNLFRTTYVVTDAFDASLFTLAQHAQAAREGGDYEAVKPSQEEAERHVRGAADFIAASSGCWMHSRPV